MQERGGVMRWTSPAGHVLRTWPERPFVPVELGEGVDESGARKRTSDPPPAPPDHGDPFDEEVRRLLERDTVPAPF